MPRRSRWRMTTAAEAAFQRPRRSEAAAAVLRQRVGAARARPRPIRPASSGADRGLGSEEVLGDVPTRDETKDGPSSGVVWRTPPSRRAAPSARAAIRPGRLSGGTSHQIPAPPLCNPQRRRRARRLLETGRRAPAPGARAWTPSWERLRSARHRGSVAQAPRVSQTVAAISRSPFWGASPGQYRRRELTVALDGLLTQGRTIASSARTAGRHHRPSPARRPGSRRTPPVSHCRPFRHPGPAGVLWYRSGERKSVVRRGRRTCSGFGGPALAP
jgi:hypothetical protein